MRLPRCLCGGYRDDVIKGRVLLIDEDMGFRAVLGARLELLQLGVDHAFDFQSAIAKLIRNDYDLVLCDAKRVAGSMHGGHVARWVQAMRLELPVHFLEKPVRLAHVAELVRRHIPAVVRVVVPREPSEVRG